MGNLSPCAINGQFITMHIMLDRTPKEKKPPELVLKPNLGTYVGGTGLNWHMIGLRTDSTESNLVANWLITGIRRSVQPQRIILRCKLVMCAKNIIPWVLNETKKVFRKNMVWILSSLVGAWRDKTAKIIVPGHNATKLGRNTISSAYIVRSV